MTPCTAFAHPDHEQRPGQPIHVFCLDQAHEARRRPDLMDCKSCCIDNIFLKRLWWSPKYECVYLHAWETNSQAKAGIRRLMTFYIDQRPLAAHGGQPPTVIYSMQPDHQPQRVA